MQECLGISITDKLIKYAKVKKDSNIFSVSSYGVKFYNNIEETIQQIINETNSNNIPISTEVKNEKYYFFNIFSLTNRTYAEKAIKTEFESFCTENHLNVNLYDGRYIYSRNLDNEDQSRIVYIYDAKNDLEEKKSYFAKTRLTTLVPLPTSLPNLINAEKGKNSMIINLEEQTTVTTVINQAIHDVAILENGMKEAFEKINEKENSYSKTYDVCKNTTIYTMETEYSQAEQSEYLKYIVPTLYKISEEVQKLKEKYKRIDNIYITGLGAVINNIDLYFKEYFKDSKVEILRPFFLDNSINVNIKDYIEVNSAISLAMQGLGNGIKNLNFLTRDWKTEIKTLLTSDVGSLKKQKGSKQSKPKPSFNFDLSGKFDKTEMWLLRSAITVLMVTIVYSLASVFLVNQIQSKKAKAIDVSNYAKEQLELVNRDDSTIVEKTKDYNKYVTNLEDIGSALETKRSRKNQLTTFLNKIVYIIPDKVTLLKIDNTEVVSGETTIQHITMQAQSSIYEQLAYFKAKLKNANVLDNIVSTEGQNDGTNIKITIEGDLRTY